MALQVIWTSSLTQVTSPVAYARVISINVDSINQTIDLGIGIYASALARDIPGTLPFDTFHAWPSYGQFLGTPVDVRTASYQYLKQLPEFLGAADV